MVKLIYGKKNTGKSAYYENLISNRNENKLYFATLWKDAETHQTILRHQKRRGSDWILLESVGNYSKDVEKLGEMIQFTSLPLSIMVDGLVNWCMFCSSQQMNYLTTPELMAKNFSIALNGWSDVTWYLLDNTREDFSNVPAMLKMWDTFNMLLMNIITDITVLPWNNNG